MLTDNERDNHPVQRQRFTENEHNEHAHKEFVLIVTARNVTAAALRPTLVGNGRVAGIFLVGGKERDLTGPVADGPNAVIAHNANAETRRQSTESAAQSGAQVGHARIDRIRIFARGGIGLDNGLSQNDADNETVNADDTGHDNGNDVFHDRRGVPDAGMHNANAGLPCAHLL